MTVTGCHNLKLGPVKRSSFKIVKWPRSRQYETIKPAHFGPNFFCLSLVEIEGKASKNSIKLLKFCDPRSQLFVCELEHFAENQIMTKKLGHPVPMPDCPISLFSYPSTRMHQLTSALTSIIDSPKGKAELPLSQLNMGKKEQIGCNSRRAFCCFHQDASFNSVAISFCDTKIVVVLVEPGKKLKGTQATAELISAPGFGLLLLRFYERATLVNG